VNEVVSGANSAKIAMTNAAEKANAAIRGLAEPSEVGFVRQLNRRMEKYVLSL